MPNKNYHPFTAFRAGFERSEISLPAGRQVCTKNKRLCSDLRQRFFAALRMTVMISAFLPAFAHAATVGFVPNTGLWFSKSEFTPGEVIQVYTVVVNNEHYAVEGTVGFYDNNKLINTIELKNLLKSKAEQLAVHWKPTEGAHSLNARFIRAAALDAQGKKLTLSLGSINSVVGALLRLNGSGGEVTSASALQSNWSPGAEVVVNSTSGATADILSVGAVGAKAAPPATAAAEANLPASSRSELEPRDRQGVVPVPIAIVVKKQGDKLVLTTPSASASVAVSAGSAGEESRSAVRGAPDELGQKVDEIFAKNRAAIAKAQELVGTITTTAGTISNLYAKTKTAVAGGQGYYEAGERQWNRLQPYFGKVTTTLQKLEPAWNKISGGNNPKRILTGGAIVVLGWILWRLARSRTREFYDR